MKAYSTLTLNFTKGIIKSPDLESCSLEKIKLHLKQGIEIYIANPLRCQKCQKYGRHKDKCTRPSICAKCGKSNHTELECQNPFNCINCTGKHPAYSQECQMWKKGKQSSK